MDTRNQADFFKYMKSQLGIEQKYVLVLQPPLTEFIQIYRVTKKCTPEISD